MSDPDHLPVFSTLAERVGYLFQTRRKHDGREWGVREAAEAIKAAGIAITHSTISQIKNGHAKNPTLMHIIGIADLFRIPRGWLAGDDLRRLGCHDKGVPVTFTQLADLESHAFLIFVYAPLSVPPLLQTGAYARAACAWIRLPDQIDSQVEQILHHQHLLARHDAPRLWVVLDEEALLRAPAGVDAQIEQIDTLLRASKEATITIQIMRPDIPGRTPEHGPFSVLSFPGQEPDVAIVKQSNIMDHLVTHSGAVGRYHEAFIQQSVIALTPDASKDMLSDIRADLTVCLPAD